MHSRSKKRKFIYANKMDNLEEMDKYLEKYNFLKLNQKEIKNMSRPVTDMEIKILIKKLKPKKKAEAQDQMASQVNSTNSLEKI